MPFAITNAILHFGLMDGSAGISVSENAFIAISDEVNQINVFSTEANSVGKEVLDLNKQVPWFPAKAKKHGEFHEADLEGGARIGDLVFWISSHGCSEDKDTHMAEQRPERQVFFATKIEGTGTDVKVIPYGKVYQALLADLISTPALDLYGLESASKELPKNGPTAQVPEEKPGLNIESLCTARDGKTLLIGFRNPVPGGKALIVPLENPRELVTEGNTKKAIFGTPILLVFTDSDNKNDSLNFGIRDMICWKNQYLIIAGHFKGHLRKEDGSPDPNIPASALYKWSEESKNPPVELNLDLNTLNPEALIAFPGERVLILSDDGNFQKKKKDENKFYQPHFRSVWLEGKD